MRLELKAKSQCRATLETLAQVKNPPVVIARQANIAPPSVGPWVILTNATGDLSSPPSGNGTLNDNLAATLNEGMRRPLPRVQDLLGFHLSV